jgi:hypothetical protein
VARRRHLPGIFRNQIGRKEIRFMDTHGEVTAVADAGAAGHGHDEHATGQPPELFEKVELEEFVADDRTAGTNIGKLLALVFLISFCLMSGVCMWMPGNSTPSHDPQAGIGTNAETESEHH